METVIIILCAAACVFSLVTLVIVLSRKNNSDNTQEIVNAVRREISSQQSALRQEMSAQTQTSVKNMGDMLMENQRGFSSSQYERMLSFEERLKTFSIQNDQKLESIRQTVD